ncbi:thiopurine S-methyltransferase [Microbulbifer donghaiensis]|uniref:Thiopurine S-methyltransferase n=1 Tax=Microbulbifer donghaiensis TaxID=494016 RepID=A0A1M4XHH0_9GAMM|nr:thiopurine S-methyltransferase [Microbulbifer donghaiensis]SHE92753.1 thiopurine S-methyltransferase [Microbulbifer donghaiensis]
MEANFWHRKWADNEIGFHASEANPLLVKHFGALSLTTGSRVFVPLCGKTLDIAWLLAQGYRVVGAELSRLAIEQLFEGLGVKPEIAQVGNILHFRAESIDVFVGDIFDLSAETLGQVDAVYDRAALVALPEDMRKRYTRHLLEITQSAPQLLITFEYDQSLQPGPPFSISSAEVEQHYSDHYALTLAESQDVAGGLKGKCAATESAWLLHNS